MSSFYKGVFWYVPDKEELIVKKVACDKYGIALELTEYSSKSGDNFNHKVEWSMLPHIVTKGKPYNFYPRGRVEIRHEKATVYLNPSLKVAQIEELIKSEFSLLDEAINIRFVADGSFHYEYLAKF